MAKADPPDGAGLMMRPGDDRFDRGRVGTVVSVACLVSAFAAITYAASSGESWPLPFAATMVACALVVCIGGLL